MDASAVKIVEMLLGQGPYGLIIIGLSVGIYKLYTRNQELHSTLYDMGREQVKANEAVTAALNRLSDLLVRGRRG